MEQTKSDLLVGVAEIDITPPVGTALAGSLRPRISTGIDDPLYVKAIVIESLGKKIAYVIFDLIALTREYGDKGVKLSSEITGIPYEIVWAATHTHTGPYTTPLFLFDESLINKKYLESLPEKMAECIAMADRKKVPANFSHSRTFHFGLCHNRRITFKNNKAINTWNIAQAPSDLQYIGTGPVDPEIGILSFENKNGKLLAVMFHFSLHTNTNFGLKFSGDYPAVVAEKIRKHFGKDVITLFVPGAFGDINSPGYRYHEIGEAIAEKIITAIEKNKSKTTSLKLSSLKKEITVPRRDFNLDQKERISDSGWKLEDQKIFWKELEILRKEGKKEDTTILQAWRIGDIGFVSFPGELFVEWGLKIKKDSPFKWTYPVGLGGDYLGYLITEKAWNEGGYEALIARSARPSPYGVEIMVNTGLKMLEDLYKEEGI